MLFNSDPRARNARIGRCGDCRRLRWIFELDGTRFLLCEVCIKEAIETVGELLSTRELYEDSTSLQWLEVHRAHGATAVIGCPWCSIGMVA